MQERALGDADGLTPQIDTAVDGQIGKHTHKHRASNAQGKGSGGENAVFMAADSVKRVPCHR